MVRQSESGRDYDLLRDRVIFPIRDNQGRIIGFGGRALDDEVKPKYINSSDSPVFISSTYYMAITNPASSALIAGWWSKVTWM